MKRTMVFIMMSMILPVMLFAGSGKDAAAEQTTAYSAAFAPTPTAIPVEYVTIKMEFKNTKAGMAIESTLPQDLLNMAQEIYYDYDAKDGTKITATFAVRTEDKAKFEKMIKDKKTKGEIK